MSNDTDQSIKKTQLKRWELKLLFCKKIKSIVYLRRFASFSEKCIKKLARFQNTNAFVATLEKSCAKSAEPRPLKITCFRNVLLFMLSFFRLSGFVSSFSAVFFWVYDLLTSFFLHILNPQIFEIFEFSNSRNFWILEFSKFLNS